jgi:acyl-coenzyme A synthetase/AMP-(fatty) acid ligase
VVGVPDDLAGELPKAFIVPKDGTACSEEELIEFCKERLSPYKRIRLVEFIDEIPKTQVGKVLRRILRDRVT